MDHPEYSVPPLSQGLSPALGAPGRQRALGEVRARFERHGERSRLARLYQTGGLRLATPNAAGAAEGVLINTGGGMAGGDEARLDFSVRAGAEVVLTTQSAEKIYRGETGAAHWRASIALDASARLEWLPQETILFEGAKLARRLNIDMAQSAALLLAEVFTFGRTAFGEDRIEASSRDSWRVRRAGKLVFAEELRLDGAAVLLPRPAIAGGARALASLLVIDADPASCLARLRAAFEAAGADGAAVEWGASRVNETVVARALSPSPSHLRATIVSVLARLRGRAAPRVWS